MTKTLQKIIFFGTEEFSATSLLALLNAGFDIAAVVTKPDTAKGRSKELVPSPVKVAAQNANITVWQPEKVADIAENIQKFDNPAGILVSYGKLIPNEILKLFKPGIINLHPSLLPKYRGPSPIESAIINGDSETGVSIMQLTREMDAGPVYSQIKLPLNGNEYADDLYKTLAKKGTEQLVASLPSILDGSLQASPQNEADVTYCQLIEKADGNIDWDQTATQIERKIRAYNIWPKSRTKLGDVDVIISKAHTDNQSGQPGSVDISNDKLVVYCGQDCLSIDTIQPLGKKEMPVQAFLAGYKSKIITR